MIYVPRGYAPDAIEFVINQGRANLWLDPGLGKTSIVLSALEILMLLGSNKFPVLVVAPKRVARGVWTDEGEKWDHLQDLDISCMIGTAQQRHDAFQKPAPIYTINYENLPWLVDGCGDNWPFKIVVADESTRLKGFRQVHGAKRAAALAKACNLTARWLNLTGTPAPNGLIDLWGPQWFVDNGAALGNSYTSFESRWFNKDHHSQLVTAKKNAEAEIIERIAPSTYSVRAAEVMDVKELIENPIMVDLPRKARQAYDMFERDMVIELKRADVTAKTAADLSLKCLQIASGALYYGEEKEWQVIHDEKLDALQSLVNDLAGNPLLVAYHFKHDLARILRQHKHAKLLVSKQDEDDWNAGKIPVGLVHPASAAHGLNLQHGGHNIAFFSHWWDLELYQQVIDRIGPVRQLQSGYDRLVVVHKIMARDTVDVRVDRRRTTKESVQSAVRVRVESHRRAA